MIEKFTESGKNRSDRRKKRKTSNYCRLLQSNRKNPCEKCLCDQARPKMFKYIES